MVITDFLFCSLFVFIYLDMIASGGVASQDRVELAMSLGLHRPWVHLDGDNQDVALFRPPPCICAHPDSSTW